MESLCQQMATVTTEHVGGWRRLFRKHAPEVTQLSAISWLTCQVSRPSDVTAPRYELWPQVNSPGGQLYLCCRVCEIHTCPACSTCRMATRRNKISSDERQSPPLWVLSRPRLWTLVGEQVNLWPLTCMEVSVCMQSLLCVPASVSLNHPP